MNLEDAVSDLYKELTKDGFPQWLTAIGQAKDFIIVYAKHDQHPKLPKTWKDWAVIVRVIGPMKFAIRPDGGPIPVIGTNMEQA
jgi:hypothetical protein